MKILYLGNDTIFGLLQDGLKNSNILLSLTRVLSINECVSQSLNGTDYIIILQSNMPSWKIQNLINDYEKQQKVLQMMLFEIRNETDVDYYTTDMNLFPEMRSVSAFFEQSLSMHYSCHHRYSRMTRLSAETSSEYEKRIGKEFALLELIRGCSYPEFRFLKGNYDFRLHEKKFFVFFYELQFEEYLDHAANKDLYNYIGERVKNEIRQVLSQIDSGEVFDIHLNLTCAIFNEPKCKSEAEKNAIIRRVIQQLAGICHCQTSSRYLSGLIENVTDLRTAYEQYRSLKSISFFEKPDYISLEDNKSPDISQNLENAQELLSSIRDLINYNFSSPDLIENLHTLYYEVIKPSRSFNLLYYCSAVLSYSLRNLFNKELILEHLDPQKLSFSSIDEQYEDIVSTIKPLQNQYKTIRQSQNSYVIKVIKYISEHYQENFSISELADSLHIGKTYLSKVFKAQVGVGIISYLTSYRLEAAKNLLKETDLPVYEIAEQVGFQDGRYFSKIFKKATGLQPREYRKK